MLNTSDLPVNSGRRRTKKFFIRSRSGRINSKRIRKYFKGLLNEYFHAKHDDDHLERIEAEQMMSVDERSDQEYPVQAVDTETMLRWNDQDLEEDLRARFGDKFFDNAIIVNFGSRNPLDEVVAEELSERFWEEEFKKDFQHHPYDHIDEAINSDAAEYALENSGYYGRDSA